MMSKLKMLLKKNYWYVVGLLVTGIIFLILLLTIDQFELPVIAQLMARFHPLILHFPIVLVFVIFAFEVSGLLGYRWINNDAKAGLLILTLLSTMGTIISGFLLFHSGDYSGELIKSHFNGAIFSGVVLLFATIFYVLSITWKEGLHVFYLIGLSVTIISIFFTSHMGGSVTHGKDFLTEPLDKLREDETVEIKPVEDMLLYDDVVMAFLDVKCLSCHNPNKKKGGLLLTNYSEILKGGDSDKEGIKPGDIETSELWTRISLPPEHEDHMPPEGKTPLTDVEKEILRLWIEGGASDTLTVSDVNEKFRSALDNYMTQIVAHSIHKAQTRQEFESTMQQLVPVAASLGLESDIYDVGDALLVSLAIKFPPDVVNDETLKELSPYYSVIGKLSIAGSAVTDDGAYLLSKMGELRELYVQKTKISSQGIGYLEDLPKLEILNISDTGIDDPGVLGLTKFPVLKTVYIAGDTINKSVLDAVRKVDPETKYLLEEGPYF
ncbi:MAG: c-type cytochrome domain-containing protein [Bacteroidota bacterium]